MLRPRENAITRLGSGQPTDVLRGALAEAGPWEGHLTSNAAESSLRGNVHKKQYLFERESTQTFRHIEIGHTQLFHTYR